jgi:hypothetical protein
MYVRNLLSKFALRTLESSALNPESTQWDLESSLLIESGIQMRESIDFYEDGIRNPQVKMQNLPFRIWNPIHESGSRIRIISLSGIYGHWLITLELSIYYKYNHTNLSNPQHYIVHEK